MIHQKKFYEPILETVGENISSINDVKAPHILIAGMGDCGLTMIKYIMRTAVLNCDHDDKPIVTIVDVDKKAMEKIYRHFPAVDEVLDLRHICKNIDDTSFLYDIRDAGRISYVISAFSGMTRGLQSINTIIRFLQSSKDSYPYTIPVAIRSSEANTSWKEIRRTLKKLEKAYNKNSRVNVSIHEFGRNDRVYCYSNMSAATLDKKERSVYNSLEKNAMKFNYAYSMHYDNKGKPLANKVDAGSVTDEERQEWDDLDYQYRQSCLTCSLNAEYINQVMDQLKFESHMEKLNQYISDNFQKTDSCSAWQKLKETDDPVLADLMEWEHLRWEAFMYSFGYIGNAGKEYHKKYHSFERTLPDHSTMKCFGLSHECLVDMSDLSDSTIAKDAINLVVYRELKRD